MRPRIMRAASRPTAKAEAANFVGAVLSDPVYAPEGPSRLRASRVTFMPGGRTNWHQHAVGQVLYVLSGADPCQWRALGGMTTVSPAMISCTGSPSSW